VCLDASGEVCLMTVVASSSLETGEFRSEKE